MDKKNENAFILELCKIKTYSESKIFDLMNEQLDYPYILGQLLFNRVGGSAYKLLKECNCLSKINREFRNILITIFDTNREKAKSFKLAMNELSEMLKNVSINYALLKGALLVYIYDEGLRTSNDFDILIDQDNISILANILKENGFKQGHIRTGEFIPASRFEILSSRMNRGETVPFIKEIHLPQMKYCEVDINFSLDFKASQETNIVSEFLQNIQPLIKTENAELNTLNRSHFLLHLCTHLYKEATVINWVVMGRDISLYKFMDIYLFVHEYFDEKFKNQLIFEIKKYGLEKECFYSFHYTKELFDIKEEYLDCLLEEIKPDDLLFLNQVIAPTENKIYQYDDNYVDWVFCCNRKDKLYEVNNEGMPI